MLEKTDRYCIAVTERPVRVEELLATVYQKIGVDYRKIDQSPIGRPDVRTVTTLADGREQVLKVFGPGRTFSDIPLFDDGPLPADAVAVTESTIAVIQQCHLLNLLRRPPDVCIDVIRLFASRLRAYKGVIEDMSLRDVVARVARFLFDNARGRTTLVEDSASLRLRHTQDEIAAMVGSVREVVQRALKTLEHAGLIEMIARADADHRRRRPGRVDRRKVTTELVEI